MLLILGVMLLWGIIACRFLLVALLLLPFAKRPTGQWGAIFGIAVTLGLLHFSFMFNGLKTIDAATAAIAIQLQVPFASMLAAIFFQDKLGWKRALGMAIAFLGVALIAGEPRLNGQYLALGFVIGASFIWSIANVQIKRLDHIDGFSLNAWVALFATPLLFGASALLEDGQIDAAIADGREVVWGVIFLGESLTVTLIIGGLMTIVGVAIIIIRPPRTTAPEAERL